LLAPFEIPRNASRCFAVVFIASPFAINPAIADQSATPSPAPVVSSLKDKSDTELLQLVTGQKEPPSQRSDQPWDDRVKPSPLDRLWEMPARDAAVAFVTDYLAKDVTGIKFEIDDSNARPPAKGEIGMRWISGNKYAPRQEGVTILRFDGYDSVLLMSQVEVVGRPSKQELERAVMKTDSHQVRQLVAQQTYEILWWLRHVRSVGTPNIYGGASYSSGDDFGRFWMKPDGPVIEKAIFGEPCGQCIDGESVTTYQSFAETLIRRLAERSGIKQRYPIPTVGHPIDNDPDSIFLRTNPPPNANDQKATREWVGRLLKILENPKRDFLYYSVMEMLVPSSDPPRYNDDRINVALLDVLKRSEKASATLREPQEQLEEELDYSKFSDEKSLEKEEKARQRRRNKAWLEGHKFRMRKMEIEANAKIAAEKLGLRDSVSAFPDVLRLSPKEATVIVVRHPELREKIMEYLRRRISGNEPGTIELIWRTDLRDFTPWLETLANATPPNAEAKSVLLAWRESDPLTKTKLDIMLTGKIGGGAPIPEVLRAEFEGLSNDDKATIRNFVNWMRTIDVPWSRRYIENVITPHTPRPDILFER
jgi:hypothetical protein